MTKCGVVNCQNLLDNGGKMCKTCQAKYESPDYYVHVCESCRRVVSFTRRITLTNPKVVFDHINCQGCREDRKLSG